MSERAQEVRNAAAFVAKCQRDNENGYTFGRISLLEAAEVLAETCTDDLPALLDALAPFARFAEVFHTETRGVDLECLYVIHHPAGTATLRMSDCQRALTLLRKHGRLT